MVTDLPRKNAMISSSCKTCPSAELGGVAEGDDDSLFTLSFLLSGLSSRSVLLRFVDGLDERCLA